MHFPDLGLGDLGLGSFPDLEGAADTLGAADFDGETLTDGYGDILGAAEYFGQTPALTLSQPSGMTPPLSVSKNWAFVEMGQNAFVFS